MSNVYSAEKRFYDQNIISRESPGAVLPTVEQRWLELHTPGDRYYCVADFLQEGSSMEAIEWGFGDAARCAALSRFFRKYTAIDLCASTLVKKVALHERSFSYRDSNLNDDLPFADESFDASIAMMVIEHLFDPFHSFREIARTTKRNGYVFVNLPLVSSIKCRLAVACGGLPVTSVSEWWNFKQWDGGHLHYFNISSVRRLAAESGLRFIRFYVVGKFLPLKRIAPSLFCHEGSFVFQKS
jgi:SAM-dependent methyltransferase